MDYLKMLISILLIAGAINWGLVAYNGMDLVTIGSQAIGQPQADRMVKLTVGAAGLYALYELVMIHLVQTRM
jgi:uncharacterized membrane protein YuzA (DUF378 family)